MSMLEFEEYKGKLNALKPTLDDLQDALHLEEAKREIAELQEESAQGTTEYAILVGVLVVIAIIAIVAFKGKVQDLWNAISEGINSL